MKVIALPRQKGKTTQACELAKKTGAYLAVINEQEAVRINDKAGRFPITYNELFDDYLRASRVRNIVIDNIDLFIMHLLGNKGLKLEGFTVTVDGVSGVLESELFEKAIDAAYQNSLAKGDFEQGYSKDDLLVALKAFALDVQKQPKLIDKEGCLPNVEINTQLLEALKDFAQIAAIAKPNCGNKLRALIQKAQEKHSGLIRLTDKEGV